MEEKKFDIIGIGHPCVDYMNHITSLPGPNESRGVLDGSWQCGGKVPTGLVAASRCGLSCALISAMGDDIFGRYCYDDFVKHNIDLSHSLIREGQNTDLGVVLSEEETNGRNIIYRGGNYTRLRPEEIDFAFLKQADYLFIAVADELHTAAAKYAKENGIKVLIDADGGSLRYYENILPYIDYFVASEFVYKENYQDQNYQQHMEEIRRKGPSVVVFTFGDKGARGLSDEGYFEVPAFLVPVVDTVGAGDTFHGAFFYGLKHNCSIKDTVIFASAVSAIKCTCIGGRAGIPTPDVTHRFIETGIIDDTELKKRVEQYSWGLSSYFRETIKN